MTSRRILWASLLLASVLALVLAGSLLDEAGRETERPGTAAGSARATSLDEFVGDIGDVSDEVDIAAHPVLEGTPAQEGASAGAESPTNAGRAARSAGTRAYL